MRNKTIQTSMLSSTARSLLGILPGQALPSDLAELYDRYFASNAYRTRFDSGWCFSRRGAYVDGGFDLCLSHLTAQYAFYLDSEFRVYVAAESDDSYPIQIASSFISLAEEDAILVSSNATGGSRRGFGQFPSYDAFFAAHGDYVSDWPEAEFADSAFGRFFLGPTSVVGLGRFYSDEYLIGGMEYF